MKKSALICREENHLVAVILNMVQFIRSSNPVDTFGSSQEENLVHSSAYSELANLKIILSLDLKLLEIIP